MQITLTQIEKQHDANKLHDALTTAGLTVQVEGKPDGSESYFTFADEDEAAVQAVIDAYVYVDPGPPQGAWYATSDASTALQYKSWAGLLTQSEPATITSGPLTVGVRYTLTTYASGDDFANVAEVESGVVNTTGCVFIATGTTPTNYSHGSTLDSDGAPAARVLYNSLGGDIVWSYNGPGIFVGTLADTFLSRKTVFPGGDWRVLSPSFADDLWMHLGYDSTGEDIVTVDTWNGAGVQVDGALANTYVEIRIYFTL
jgi:hypothetical protein